MFRTVKMKHNLRIS